MGKYNLASFMLSQSIAVTVVSMATCCRRLVMECPCGLGESQEREQQVVAVAVAVADIRQPVAISLVDWLVGRLVGR